jgi:hypothetical protein
MIQKVTFAAIIGALLALPTVAREAKRVPNTPEARLAAEAYAKCVAEYSPDESARVLSMNFTTSRYRTALRMLSKASEQPCARDSIGKGVMRGDDLVFAGAVAEALIESATKSVNVRLARVPADLKVLTFSPTDAVASCVARSDPDGTGKLFATDSGSSEEVEAAQALSLAVGRCAQKSAPMSLSPLGLRSILATASFRLLAAQES